MVEGVDTTEFDLFCSADIPARMPWSHFIRGSVAPPVFGGTTQVTKSAPTQTSSRGVTVRFDSNVTQDDRHAAHTATNASGRVTTALAPPTVGAYFRKLFLLHGRGCKHILSGA